MSITVIINKERESKVIRTVVPTKVINFFKAKAAFDKFMTSERTTMTEEEKVKAFKYANYLEKKLKYERLFYKNEVLGNQVEEAKKSAEDAEIKAMNAAFEKIELFGLQSVCDEDMQHANELIDKATELIKQFEDNRLELLTAQQEMFDAKNELYNLNWCLELLNLKNYKVSFVFTYDNWLIHFWLEHYAKVNKRQGFHENVQINV